jgi:hypothetical protein
MPNTIPQAVTERYVSNLIHYGRNKEFDIKQINRVNSLVDDEVVGVYFGCCIILGIEQTKEQWACGATISQAVRRALEKHGVTFR